MKNKKDKTSQFKAIIIWVTILVLIVLPIILSLSSPLLAYRDPIYIGAGLAGVFSLALLFAQPLLALGRLPFFSSMKGRKLHKYCGALLALMVVLHVVGLWITSPPDVIDVLLFKSPTPFSVWGVIAMWAVFISAFMAVFRTKLLKTFKPRLWRYAHISLALAIVIGTVVHAMQIEGTMEFISKIALCFAVSIVTLNLVFEQVRRKR